MAAPGTAAARMASARVSVCIQLAIVGAMVAVYFLLDRFVPNAPYVRTIIIVALALVIVIYYSYRSRQLRLARLRAVEEMQGNLQQLSMIQVQQGQLVATPDTVVPVATVVGHASTITPADSRRHVLVPGLPVRMLGTPPAPLPTPPVAFTSAAPPLPTGAPLELLLERLANAATVSEVAAALEAVLWWANSVSPSECVAACTRVSTVAQHKRSADPQLWTADIADLFGRVMQRLRGYNTAVL